MKWKGSYHSIQHWASRSGVAFSRSDIGRPLASVSRNTSRDDMAVFACRESEVENCQPKVPEHDQELGDDLGGLLSDCTHSGKSLSESRLC